jgi:hypothetical protein
MIKHLNKILVDFEPISLKEMDCVQLLDRTDTKFVFHSNRLKELLTYSQKYYKILQIDHERDFSYHTMYLDTSNYLFFNQHMSGRPTRYKVRYRIYESTGVSYLEVKCKNNRNRTIKWRIKNEFKENNLDITALDFLSCHISEVAFNINPVLINKFRRLTLVGIETKERITIDYDVSFHCAGGTQVELPYLSIAELKRVGYTNNSPFLSILKKMQIRKSSFSKYCIGNALLKPMPKTNILKSNLLQLKKIENDKSIYSFV